jgi:putative membrane protein
MKNMITKRRVFCAAVVIAIIVVPFLYSYFYLGAFWDPYSKLDSLPVAVVNKDTGAVINDTERNLGQELCDRLKEDGSLKFVFTEEKAAKEGTEGADYYATITIPEDFSKNISSVTTDDKQTAMIKYSPNEKRNFLASQILGRALLQVEEETRSTVDKEIVQGLVNTIGEVPDQLSELQDGLGKLSDGSNDLLDGIEKLSEGTDTLYEGTTTLREGTKTLSGGSEALADGTGKLLDGTGSLLNGTTTLTKGTTTYVKKFGEYREGVSTLKEGSTALATGADTLEAGIGQLKTGVDVLVEKTATIGQLTTGTQILAEGSKTLDAGLTQYTTGVNTLLSTVNNTVAFLEQYAKAHPSLLQDPTFVDFMTKLSDPKNAQSFQVLAAAGPQLNQASVKMVAGTEQIYKGTQSLPELNTALVTLRAGASKLKTGATDLSEGADKLTIGIDTLSGVTNRLYTAAIDIAGGADELNSGIINLNRGAKDLNRGATKLTNGVENLNEGAQDLNRGAKKLNSGATKLNDGAKKLSEGLDTANSSVINSVTEAKDQIGALDGMAEFAATPVTIDQENVTSIANYGTAFAPYFMSLSLWVGALILFVGIYLDTEGKFKILSRESDYKVARSFMFLLIGIAQAIALALIVKLGLGLKVDNVPLYYTSICLVSMVFIAMVQFFMVHLKSAGKLVSIVLLILQLTSCGGTFPMELVPKVFNDLYPFMPMTYSVGLFKNAITDTDSKAVLYNGGILVAILVVFMAMTIILSGIKSKKADKATVQMPVQFE